MPREKYFSNFSNMNYPVNSVSLAKKKKNRNEYIFVLIDVGTQFVIRDNIEVYFIHIYSLYRENG